MKFVKETVNDSKPDGNGQALAGAERAERRGSNTYEDEVNDDN